MRDLIYMAVIVATSLGWYADRARLSGEVVKWKCQFEIIDPIRAEAEVPLSECCRDWLKN